MDSRNIKEEPNTPVNFLEAMYGLQKELLNSYIAIEGLPPYPININTKANQTLLKDFSSRVIEELMEAYEAMISVNNIMQKRSTFFTLSHFHKDDGDVVNEINDFNLMVSHLQNVGEELADATHFMLELLIYSNIQPIDIVKYSIKLNYPANEGDDALKVGYNVGKKWYLNDLGFDVNFMQVTNVTDISKIYDQLIDMFGNRIQDIDKRFIKVGGFYSHGAYYFTRSLIFSVVYHLNIARNFLKNKPWKQSQMMTDESAFQAELVEAFMALCSVWAFLGGDPELIFWLYFKKNRVNMFRIKSKY